VEALIRWRDPEGGLVSPGAFIPVLESTGFIVEVGEWVLQRAALDCQRWLQLGLPPIRIAVNISPAQLRRPDFLHRFFKHATQSSTGKCCLDVEITEGTLHDDSNATLKKLEQLRMAGVRVAIDDFGTGYSSLSRLADLAIDTLKIDRSFINRLRCDDKSGQSLVRTVVSLARTFDMTVVAEGVETVEQLNILADIGCDQSQGYLHSKPVTHEEMTRLIQHGSSDLILPAQFAESSNEAGK
jgi:EAL domain-containing protein (putative c-di-GMP-specific phosphodiesterase class I)